MIIWRMFAKRTLLRVLPPIFRQADKLFDLELTTRRFYKAATWVVDLGYHCKLMSRDYDKIPQPKIRSVPSVLDLHPDDSPSPSNGGSPSSGRSPVGSIASSPILIASSASTHLPLDAKSQEGIRERNLPRTPDTTAVETYGGEQYVWVSRRQRKSRADRAKYDAEGERACQRSTWNDILTCSLDEGRRLRWARLSRYYSDPDNVRHVGGLDQGIGHG